MSQLVNYSIIEAGLRALADKAHESAVAQAEGKPIPCGLSEGDMELVALLTAMMYMWRIWRGQTSTSLPSRMRSS